VGDNLPQYLYRLIYTLKIREDIMIEELERIGFDEKEAKIYLALLEIGKGTANQIMQNTNIERRTIYDVLERLIQKGFASYYKEDKTTTYVPTDPKIILQTLEDKKSGFEKIIPSLTQLKEKNDTVEVELLKGKDGLHTIFHDIYNSGKTHYSFGKVNMFNEKYNLDLKKVLGKLELKGMSEKIIYPKGKEMITIKRGEYRQLDEKMMPPTPVVIYGDTTCLFIFSEPPITIRIKSKEIAQTHMKYFNTYWNMSEKPKNVKSK
jgi:HTH-type transcriptional regulator, sugar sensing transcriptional regulator